MNQGGDETDTSKVASNRMRWAGREPRGDETDTSKVASNREGDGQGVNQGAMRLTQVK